MKTYNLIEAVNSGKRFKKPNTDAWLYVGMINGIQYIILEGFKQFMDKGLITSEYILEEKEITITESEFDEAFNRADHTDGVCKDLLKEELGF